MKKRFVMSLIVGTLMLSLIACGKSVATQNEEKNVQSTDAISENESPNDKEEKKEASSIFSNKNEEVVIDYADAESFEMALNAGENLEGKIVQFEALELHPDSAMGYNVWAGEHLNFISSRNPDIKAGDLVVVKCEVIESLMGSWYIKYEKVDNAVIADSTISASNSNGSSTFSVDSTSIQQPLELVDYGFYMNESSGDKVYVDFCGIIHNPNENLIAEFPSVVVTVKNGEGAVLATEEQMGSVVMPGDTITLCGMFSMLTSKLTEDSQIFYDVEWESFSTASSLYSKAKTSDFEITNVTETNGSENYITGEIKNNYSEDVNSINLSIVLRKDGEIVYMENTFLDNLRTGQTKAFEFHRYHNWPEHDAIDVSAMVW